MAPALQLAMLVVHLVRQALACLLLEETSLSSQVFQSSLNSLLACWTWLAAPGNSDFALEGNKILRQSYVERFASKCCR